MTRISPLWRSLRGSIPSSTSRSIHSTSITSAAAAPAPRAPPRRIAVAASPRIPRATPTSSSAPTPKPAPGPRQASFDDIAGIDDGDIPVSTSEFDGIDDYAPLVQTSAPTPARAKSASGSSSSTFGSSASNLTLSGMSNVTPSPPLTAFPNDSYRPLPTTAAGDGIAGDNGNDWSTSFAGLSQRPFDKEVADALLKPLRKEDVEVKPDGLLYLPEIKYRRTLNAAFGPGGWGLAPRGETHVDKRIVSREWGLVCLGRLVSVARGEQEYFDESGIPTATEACKSNALMRCCKDLGIASELWDPSFIREFKAKHLVEVWVEHAKQKTKRKLWRKKDAAKFDYPYKEVGLA